MVMSDIRKEELSLSSSDPSAHDPRGSSALAAAFVELARNRLPDSLIKPIENLIYERERERLPVPAALVKKLWKQFESLDASDERNPFQAAVEAALLFESGLKAGRQIRLVQRSLIVVAILSSLAVAAQLLTVIGLGGSYAPILESVLTGLVIPALFGAFGAAVDSIRLSLRAIDQPEIIERSPEVITKIIMGLVVGLSISFLFAGLYAGTGQPIAYPWVAAISFLGGATTHQFIGIFDRLFGTIGLPATRTPVNTLREPLMREPRVSSDALQHAAPPGLIWTFTFGLIAFVVGLVAYFTFGASSEQSRLISLFWATLGSVIVATTARWPLAEDNDGEPGDAEKTRKTALEKEVAKFLNSVAAGPHDIASAEDPVESSAKIARAAP